MASSEYEFFITTAEHLSLKAGSIVYINECRYSRRKDGETRPVKTIDSGWEFDLPIKILQPLLKKEAEFLLALESDEDRLQALAQLENLDQVGSLVPGSEVTVELNDQWLKGVVKYIGPLAGKKHPISPGYFGVELQGEDAGKGITDGNYGGRPLFSCKRDAGVFVPFTRIRSVHPEPSAPLLDEQTFQRPCVGDRVTYFVDNKREGQHGMVIQVLHEDQMVIISTDRDDNGQLGGEVVVPWVTVFKEEDLKEEDMKMDTSSNSESAPVSIGSLVEVTLASGPSFATVRWIGTLPGKSDLMAGLELEENTGVNDGKFKNTRYFTCPDKRGLFVKLSSCRPDVRFLGETAANGHFEDHGRKMSPLLENVPPVPSPEVKRVLIGRMKGIQGHCNSCYMDSALFSLFSCSSVLDSLLFKKTTSNAEAIQKSLRSNIVCPLRSKGFVPEKSVMKLRKQLQDRSRCSSYTTEEKDPEEFLTLIMQDILSLDPLLKLQSSAHHKGGVKMEESGYFYQIIMDYNNSLVLPTVQQLLEHSFYNNSLRLVEVPSCLILTMPRSGKQFKMFPKIIPSLELDVTALLSSSPQQCVLCGRLADVECPMCFVDSVFGNTGFKLFCATCSAQVHMHPDRSAHKPVHLHVPEGFSAVRGPGTSLHPPPREKLELFAVLCIETSHYVSFVKHGPGTSDWIFFDSMADRQGETNGFNIPEVKSCPEVARYLSMPLAELAKQVPREMEGVAKRLFCDGYMYLYQSTRMALYR